MDEKEISLIIEAAIKKALFPAAEPYKVSNKTKSVSEVIKDKKLSYVDKGSDTLSAMRSIELVGKSVGSTRTKEDYRPTEDQIAKINAISLIDRTKDNQGYVFTFQATNLAGAPDRSHEGFSEAANKEMGAMAVKNRIPYLVASKSDCEDHTWKAINSYGTIIDYKVDKGGLFYETFVPENDSTKDILQRMFDTQLSKLSVGFSMSYSDVLCNSCRTKSIVDEDCPHYPGDQDEQGKTVTITITKIKDNYEISAVAVPCQAEAHITGRSLDKEDKMAKNKKALITEPAETKFVNLDKETSEEVKSLIELQADGMNFAESVKKIAEILDSVEENLNIDKIDNDNIEVKNLMEPEVDKKLETETPAEAVVNVGLTEERLCKVAENIKSQVVAELKAVIEANTIDLTEVLDELKGLKKQVKKLKEAVKVAESVPVSPAAAELLIKESFTAPKAAESLNVSTDQMIVY